MPSDLAITGAWRIAQPAAPREAAQTPAAPVVLRPNPSAWIDAKNWIVILEFHDGAGNVTYTIPSRRGLAARAASEG